jgi:hypothetical protein
MSAAARRKLSRPLKQGWAEGKMKPRAKAKPAKASTGGLVTFSLASVLRQCYLVQPRAGSRKSCISQQACRDLDANLAEAHALMGWIKTYYDWDWAGADASYQRALALEPGNGTVVRGAAGLAAALGRSVKS